MDARGGTSSRWPITDDLGALRGQVRDFAVEAGLDGFRLQDLVLAVNEAAANVLDHAHGEGHVLAWSDDGHVTVEVCDMVGRLVPAHAEAGDPGAGKLRGRGLWLMGQLCDEVRITQNPRGSSVRLRQSLAEDPAPR
ncbi:ATP-binding protein [Sphaerisporangium sp. TRM90804]|uniref:ATP-binding protein n=1 Tax=Sphaerisporangium sp. TRM90804 TaxID=3031113 RepID=UPI0024499850|nr:ATP-binding protein [Sphaerisporangium sp. TRM90804]MDH2426158.1 ATP-binding protein [Sphaerisporangium sp. TRM90804]